MGGVRARRTSWVALVTAVAVTLSCRDELVQTAVRLPDANPTTGGAGGTGALDCLLASPATALPAGAVFGEGTSVESWPMVGVGDSESEGPGLYVVSRDTFRVYVNGHLVAQSAVARTPFFLPLSLLPGENTIALAVGADSGTPAALVVLDDIERRYVSNREWRANTNPQGDWTAAGYDDGDWMAATELAELGTLAGCDPTSDFPDTSDARWIGPELGTPGPVALRTTVRIEPVGFAEGTTGGGSTEPQLVSSWDELETLAASDAPATLVLREGLHDFRRAGDEIDSVEVCPTTCSDENARVVYAPYSSSCVEAPVTLQRTERVLRVGSNKTVVGLGRGAALRGLGIDMNGSRNVVIRNVALFDINRDQLEAGDALGITDVSGLWLDHATFRWVSDAFADVIESEGITLSYSLFYGGNDGECEGQERWAMSLIDAQVTIHHSRFEQVSSHAPFADGSAARVHLFNDIYSHSLDWTIGSGCLAQVRLEGSVFENVDVVSRLSTCSETTDRGLMNAVDGSNLYRDGDVYFVGEDGAEPHDEVFIPDYEYEVEPAADAWSRVILRVGAGGLWALPLSVD